ncbi:MAG: hypothetical protein SGCHY_002010 [Lobulomycetales sp.]
MRQSPTRGAQAQNTSAETRKRKQLSALDVSSKKNQGIPLTPASSSSNSRNSVQIDQAIEAQPTSAMETVPPSIGTPWSTTPTIGPAAPTEELAERQRKYQYSYSKNIKSPFLDTMPAEQFPSTEWGEKGIDILKNLGEDSISHIFRAILRSSDSETEVHPKDIDGYLDTLYDSVSSVQSVALLNSDEAFGYWRLAGPNPVSIEPCKSLSHIHFPENMQQGCARKSYESRIRDALRDSRLYQVDYTAFQNFTPSKATKFTMAAIALFEIPSDRLCRERYSLDPLAIQVMCKTSKPQIIFPCDGAQWKIAKCIFSSLDGDYHEAIVHLGRTHLVMESFMVATYRQLPGKHPLFQLLSPHLEGTAFINNAADKDLIGPGGIVEQLVSQKIGEVNDFVGKSVCEFLKQDLTFPALIKAQGMTQDAFPANFPYRDDGMLIWNAIHTWANDFVEIFYPSDSSIKADEYLAAWVSEMVHGGMIAWLQDFQFTKSALVDLLSAIIFTGSAGHASVNFPQRNLMQYTPAWPLGMYNTPPIAKTADETDYLTYLPPVEMAREQARTGFLLGGVHYTQLGNYEGDLLSDRRTKMAHRIFKNNLDAAAIEIEKRNEARVRAWGNSNPDAKAFAYTQFMPEGIPQSINI